MAEAEAAAVQEMATRIEANKQDVQAYLKQGQAKFRLEEYAAADAALEEGAKQAEALLKSINMWRRKCGTHLQEATPAPAAAAATAATPAPQAEAAAAPAAAAEQAAPTPAAPAKAPDVRLDWFQTASNATVCFFIRMGQQMPGSTDHATVDVKERSLQVAIKLKDGSSYSWKADPLFGEVDLATTTVSVKHMKVEIVLQKKHSGEQWESLEGTLSAQSFPDKPSAYPTSHKKGVDWTKYTVDDEEEKPEGNDALNKLLQDIYSRGDDTTRKAMNKSFTESSGTVLSTNWGEVGTKKVDGQAPKGMVEAKY